MPAIKVVFYCEGDGSVPLLDWFDTLPAKVLAKCRVKIERLQEFRHELRRPEVDVLRDGVYELRVGFRSIIYRMLYFFHGNVVVVLVHGLTKNREVPPKEIDKALERKVRFEANPKRHTHEEV